MKEAGVRQAGNPRPVYPGSVTKEVMDEMRTTRRFFALFLAVYMTSFFCGCQKAPQEPATQRQTRTAILTPEASGQVVYGNDLSTIDASNTSEGYLYVSYHGDAAKAKVQITIPDQTVYTYTLQPGSGEVLPLTGGPGSYTIHVLENAFDNMYALAFSQELEVPQVDELRPYLYPNQFSWFTQDSDVTALGMEISQEAYSDVDYVERVYSYVTRNIAYDLVLAQDPPVSYLPSPDATLASGKGICLDYASLMTALLRSQGIPTKLVVGYSGQQYHAWISVYLEEEGWVDNTIYFDGSSWILMDPTLRANNKSSDVRRYLGDGSNYQVRYQY